MAGFAYYVQCTLYILQNTDIYSYPFVYFPQVRLLIQTHLIIAYYWYFSLSFLECFIFVYMINVLRPCCARYCVTRWSRGTRRTLTTSCPPSSTQTGSNRWSRWWCYFKEFGTRGAVSGVRRKTCRKYLWDNDLLKVFNTVWTIFFVDLFNMWPAKLRNFNQFEYVLISARE